MKGRMKRIMLAILVIFMIGSLYAQEPPTIAVLDFELEDVSEKDMKLIVSLFSSALFQTGQFTVIESTKRDTVLDEMKFSASGLTDSDSIREIGRLLSAEGLVVGDIGKVGTRFILSVKLLETETAKTLASADGRYADLDELLDGLDTLAAQLAGVETAAAVADTTDTEPSTDEGTAETATETLPLTGEESAKPKRARSGRPGLWLGVGGATLVGGGVLAFTTIQFKQNEVDTRYDDYLNGEALWPGPEPFSFLSEPEQREYFDNLYSDYEAKRNQFLIRSIASLTLGAAGTGFLTLGTLQLIGSKSEEVAVNVGFREGATTLSFQVRR